MTVAFVCGVKPLEKRKEENKEKKKRHMYRPEETPAKKTEPGKVRLCVSLSGGWGGGW